MCARIGRPGTGNRTGKQLARNREGTGGKNSQSRVEEGRGGLRLGQSLRFPSPLIKPDGRISRIRLSDRLHGGPTATTNRRRLRLAVELVRSAPDRSRCFAGSSPITSILTHFASTSEVRGLCSAGVTSTLLRPCPTPARGRHPEDGVETRGLAQSGSPLITRLSLPTRRAHYPGGSSRCICR